MYDTGVLPVREPLERRLSRVARGRHEHEVVVELLAGGQPHRYGLREEQRHALQGHVLEGARRAVPQLQHVHPRLDLDERSDRRVVEVLAVRPLHQRLDLLRVHVHAEVRVDSRRAARVGQVRHRYDLTDGE
jgi:hypothetical protein